jgi:hypothetical protein
MELNLPTEANLQAIQAKLLTELKVQTTATEVNKRTITVMLQKLAQKKIKATIKAIIKKLLIKH